MKIKCSVCHGLNTNKSLIGYNSHGQHIYSKRKQYIYYKCNDCEALFLTNIVINSKFYKTYYSKIYRETALDQSFLSILLTKSSNNIKIKLLEKFTHKKKIKLLDVGSGDGNFLISLNNKRYDSFGLEIDDKYMQIYKKNNIKLLTGKYLTKKFATKFDIITAWHVIEHLPNLNNVFKKSNNLLSKKGLLIFSIPNYLCFGFDKGKEDWFHLDAPRHLIFLTPATVKYLAQKYNFQILKIENNWYDFPTDIFWSLKNYKYKLLVYLIYPLIKFADKETVTYILKKND